MIGSRCDLEPYKGGHLEQKVTNWSKFGKYSIDMKTSTPLNTSYGIDNAFYVYNGTTTEIDYEFLTAEPQRIRLTIWVNSQNRTERIINMTTGNVDWSKRCFGGSCVNTIHEPLYIKPMPNYDHSARYYNYAFEWLSNRLTFYMKNENGVTVYLWNFTTSSDIPKDKAWTTLATTYINDYGEVKEKPLTDVTAYYTNYSYSPK